MDATTVATRHAFAPIACAVTIIATLVISTLVIVIMTRKSDGATVIKSLFAAIAISGLVGIAAAISSGEFRARKIRFVIIMIVLLALSRISGQPIRQISR